MKTKHQYQLILTYKQTVDYKVHWSNDFQSRNCVLQGSTPNARSRRSSRNPPTPQIKVEVIYKRRKTVKKLKKWLTVFHRIQTRLNSIDLPTNYQLRRRYHLDLSRNVLHPHTKCLCWTSWQTSPPLMGRSSQAVPSLKSVSLSMTNHCLRTNKRKHYRLGKNLQSA